MSAEQPPKQLAHSSGKLDDDSASSIAMSSLTAPASDPTISANNEVNGLYTGGGGTEYHAHGHGHGLAAVAAAAGLAIPDLPHDFSQYDDSEDEEHYQTDTISIERIRKYLSDKLGFYTTEKEPTTKRKVLETVDVDGVIKHWQNGGFKKIITMVGAGISTSAGIPDFRSPDTGLYNNLMKYNLPYPQAIFELDYLYQNPKPFFQLAKELYPGNFKPTPSHYFVKLLEKKGLLIRHYTQNIDTLERIAGINEEKIVEAHGTFYTNHCLQCKAAYSLDFVKEKIFADEVPTCPCGGVVKPDIVFFGEGLPERFHMLPQRDFDQCDLLIIMGTSLTVQPFASLVEYVNDDCVRLLINRDKVGSSSGYSFFRAMMFGEGLCFDLPGNRRDVAWTGNCDDGCLFLAEQLGWADELRELVETEHAKLETIRLPTIHNGLLRGDACSSSTANVPIAAESSSTGAVGIVSPLHELHGVTDEHFYDLDQTDSGHGTTEIPMATDSHNDSHDEMKDLDQDKLAFSKGDKT